MPTFDIVVIGAGINGAGIARDAALRGLRVLLLDKGDIAAGTTSFSTRLIHGGLRYLEYAELGLVRESLREREILLKLAPHLVKPLPLLIPIYKNRRRGRFTIRAGMVAYDLLSFDKSLPRHRMLSPRETLNQVPGLNAAGLLGAALYFDAHVEFAERLVIENVLAAQQHGARVLTYSRVDAFINTNEKISGVQFVDVLTGVSHRASASLVVNAAGPWVDEVLTKTPKGSPRLIGGTKGSHIVVAPFAGAPTGALYVEAERDARPFFVIPWNGNYLIGTTDTRYAGDLDRVEVDEGEIEYLLNETNQLFPTAELKREMILFSYSGVRPLAFTDDSHELSITRRHFIREQQPGLLSIVGGKLTTYRGLAEEVVNLIFKRLGRKDPGSTTANVALPGSVVDLETLVRELNAASSWSSETDARLLRIYGARAPEVLQLALSEPSLAAVFDPESGAIAAEVVFAFEHELARTLSDCLLRRTMVGWNSSCGLTAVAAAGQIAHEHLGWSADRVREEVAAYQQQVKRFRVT